jgi:hypothetical protein
MPIEASCDLFELTTFDEFLQRVGPRRLEEAIACHGGTDIRPDERFRDQVCHTVDDIRRSAPGALGARPDNGRRL